jgi:hypothetical protein
MFANVKAIEPFISLSSGGTKAAENSIFAYYLSSNLRMDAFLGFFQGHSLILWTTVGYSAVSIFGSFSSEMLYLDSNYKCDNPDFNYPLRPCFPPRLTADPKMLRLLQALLTFAAIMTLNLLVLVWRSSTGIYSDPSSIACVASLMHHPAVLHDFRSLDPEASAKQMKQHLGYKRYKLQDYQSADGTWRYGITPVELGTGEIPMQQAKMSFNLVAKKKSPIWETCLDILFGLAMLTCLSVIIAYYRDDSYSKFNEFFNSNTFGPRLIMVRLQILRVILLACG